jgi:NRAMP (natural resistance-associated macrophage protein)-like metal ion transporter
MTSYSSNRQSVVGPSKPRLLRRLGPGLISGASDDDPTAIATYSQAGARFGLELCWLALLCLPLMVVVQEISARVGRTTGRGIAGNLRKYYPPWLLYPGIALLLVANIAAISADLAAMGSVVQLMFGGIRLLYVAAFGAACVLAQVFFAYSRYVKILKWTTLCLLSYPAAVLLVGVDWSEVATRLVPRIAPDREWITTAIAIFGVALSPYIFFWQASQEAEDQRVKPQREPLIRVPEQAPAALERIRIDTWVGMVVAIVVGLSIIITTSATLHAHGQTDVASAAEAAQALAPIAGPFAFSLFALGIVATGLLAIPVLAGSAAYAIGEALKWPVGLARAPLEAKAFYATIGLATCAGVVINVVGIDPIRALYWSAVINGMVAAPALALMVIVASRRAVMGAFVIEWPLRLGGWIGVALISLCMAAMIGLSAPGSQ